MRFSGASPVYSLGAVLGGGFGPFIATALYDSFDTSFAVADYMTVLCVISFVAVLAIRIRGEESTGAHR